MMNAHRVLGTAVVVCIATIAAAAPASAQRNYQSDVAGVVVSGGDVTGGAFAPLPAPAAAVTFAAPAAVAQVAAVITQVANAVQATAAAVVTASAAATPAAGTPAAGGTSSSPPPAQVVLAAVLTCSGSCGGAPEALTTALQGSGGNVAAMQTSAEALTTALKGLAAQANSADAPALAIRINDARSAFVRMIGSADEAYLMNPPAELVAVHKLLVQVLEAAGSK